MEGNGMQFIVESLKLEGVKYLFGMSATGTLPLLDCIYDVPEIQYIQSQHEQGAMYMANGYARATGKIGACLVGPGPGTTNCQSAISQAYYTFAPSVLMGVEDSTKLYGKGCSMHHALDAVSVMKPVTKMAIRLERAGRIPDLMQMAFRTALSPKEGPVYLGFARDVFDETASVKMLPPDKYYTTSRPPGDPVDIDRAVKLLLRAENPVALAGVEVGTSGSIQELIRLSELLCMPVAAAESNKGVVPESHPLALGVIGITGRPYAHKAVREADVILALGTPFTEFTTWRFGHSIIPEKAKIIHVDLDASELGKNYPLEIGIVGSIKKVLHAMIQEVQERRKNPSPMEEHPRFKALMAGKKTWEAAMQAHKNSDKSPIMPGRLMNDLRKALPDDALVVGASGSTHAWFDYCFESLTHTLGIACWHPMGAEYCETLGAQLAMPDKAAVCLLGDGSMMMTLAEIATAVKYNIPVLAVVRHNALFGNMRHTQNIHFPDRFIGTDPPVPHLANTARELGAHSERISRPEEIIPSVRRALESGRPSLLEVMIDTSPEFLSPPRS
ncbi:MAG: thiamine pyrophosphate-binding protein [Desulfobacterales bacterium]|nr:thiamine pyrophosphate-binding protein [Desulfobacterales bacterium]